VLVEHPGIGVQAAVHGGLPVALVGQHVVLEASPAGLSGSNPIRALVIDVAFVHIRKMSFGGRTIIVSVPLSAHQILLNC